MTLKKRYRKYAGGGGMDLGLIQMGQQFQQSMVENIFPTNEFGHQDPLAEAMKGNAQFGTIGAALGYLRGRKQQKTDQLSRFHNQLQEEQNQRNYSNALISNDPALVTGRQGEEFYSTGGFLKGRYYSVVKASGGVLKPLSKDSAEVEGPSHAQGGVDLPQYNSQVEGGETIQDDYVFSDRLGFAKLHKKLATAIGKIEDKPTTPDRINSLKRMNQSVENLKQQQEAIRQKYNLQ